MRAPHHAHKHLPRRQHPLRRLKACASLAGQADADLGTFSQLGLPGQQDSRHLLEQAALEAALAADEILFALAGGSYSTYQDVF